MYHALLPVGTALQYPAVPVVVQQRVRYGSIDIYSQYHSNYQVPGLIIVQEHRNIEMCTVIASPLRVRRVIRGQRRLLCYCTRTAVLDLALFPIL